jgi:hypothetical protein
MPQQFDDGAAVGLAVAIKVVELWQAQGFNGALFLISRTSLSILQNGETGESLALHTIMHADRLTIGALVYLAIQIAALTAVVDLIQKPFQFKSHRVGLCQLDQVLWSGPTYSAMVELSQAHPNCAKVPDL